ncbi:MAG: pentapeptide repeat-containing protein [Myxacorys chilensis ATA2-1-KO14]|nr:pentapeptide repeat-containing protein [Myxacorys chilensis ATA2-1-KO14]
MTAEELLQRYATGERNFSGLRLYAEEYAMLLNGRDLNGVNLCGSRLDGDWSGANLSHARLRGIIADGCDLKQVNLSQADLGGAMFIECDLTGCNLTNANLSGVAFKQVVLCDANFTSADLRGAVLGEADLDRADLRGANLRGAEGVNIEILQAFGCILAETRMIDNSLYCE